MSTNTHDVENEGSKARDHSRPTRHFWKHAHRDWRVWTAAVLMIALIGVYLMTNDLSHWPGRHVAQPTPEANLP